MSVPLRFVLSLAFSLLVSLVISAAFLPVYGMVEGGSHNCLREGLPACAASAQWSLLIYGPLFSIAGLIVGTPVFMALLRRRA